MDNTNHCLSCMEDMGAGKTCYYCGYQEGTTSESILHLPPGTILQGKYLLGRALGQGGEGLIFNEVREVQKLINNACLNHRCMLNYNL